MYNQLLTIKIVLNSKYHMKLCENYSVMPAMLEKLMRLLITAEFNAKYICFKCKAFNVTSKCRKCKKQYLMKVDEYFRYNVFALLPNLTSKMLVKSYIVKYTPKINIFNFKLSGSLPLFLIKYLEYFDTQEKFIDFINNVR